MPEGPEVDTDKLREAIDSYAFAVVHKPFPVGRLLGLVAEAAVA